MKRYFIVGPVAWALLLATFIYTYKGMWDRTWLSHASFMVMMAIATTAMFGCIVAIAEFLRAFHRIPRWIRVGVGMLGLGSTFAAIAFIFGTHDYSGYNWPGFSGIAIVLFQEYRMLLFATIPLPVACCICGALVFWRGSGTRPATS